MKRAHILHAAAAALVFSSACAERSRPAETSVRMWRENPAEMTPASRFEPAPKAAAEPTSAGDPEAAATGVNALSDAQIGSVLRMIHEIEWRHAKLALEKAKSLRVRSYAAKMVSEHSKALNEAERMIEKAGLDHRGSNLLSELNTHAQATAQALQTAEETEFDRIYIDAQVTSHAQALGAIDRELAPAAASPALRKLLEKARPQVEGHLEEARSLQSRLAP